jgi:hypothetical protein
MMSMAARNDVRATMSLPAALLHLEGAAVLVGAIALYAQQGGSWLVFALLLFAPDVSAVGYLFDTRIGAVTYNVVHTYVLPIALVALAAATGSAALGQIALILFAHIGIDRMMGYGLKYPTAFKDTHLNRV